MTDKQNLLVVDWDFFFPSKEGDPAIDETGEWMLWDWGHSETMSFMLEHIWIGRAAAFKANGIPRPEMNSEWMDFWDRFNIHEEAVLYFADSNSQAYDPTVQSSWAAKTGSVWLYDAHHDSGYNKTVPEIFERGTVTCEDWMVPYRYQHQAELHVRYPRWKHWAFEVEPEAAIPGLDRQFDDGEPNPVEFHTIFVCRSGAWVPPWCDEDFHDFVYAAPVGELYEVAPCDQREWSEELVEKHEIQMRQLEELQKKSPAELQKILTLDETGSLEVGDDDEGR